MPRKSKEGFTMVEISLSIALISVLALAIVFIILNTISSYRRSLVLNNINTTGMALVDDLRTAVQNSSVQSVESECLKTSQNRTDCENGRASKFTMVTRNADVTANGASIGSIPVYGAFCTGKYSYVWNSGYYFDDADEKTTVGINSVKVIYMDSNHQKKTKENFRLLKIHDETRAICVSTFKSKYTFDFQNNFSGTFDIYTGNYGIVDEEPIDLLASVSGTSSSLALYSLTATTPAEGSTRGKLFYNVSFILGTVRGGINIKASGKTCSAPNDYATQAFDYCAINKFNFAAQANGG